ncbi:MAG: dATP pyrophosphohydrolase [Dongiaceae bacterium]
MKFKLPDILVQAVASASDLNRFIRLPGALYGSRQGFVAPLDLERRDALRRDKNPYFRHGDGQYWLAFRGDRLVGRISAQIDQLYLERHGREVGHFGLIDAIDDIDVTRALTDTASGWLAVRGMRRMVGPFSLSSNEECGLLIEGFEAPAMLKMGYAPPYLGRHLDSLGFAKAKDLVAYDYEVPPEAPPHKQRFVAKLKDLVGVTIRRLDMSRYQAELQTIIGIFNDAWSENWGFVPFTEAEMRHAANGMRPLIQPNLVWIGEIEGEAACMAVCLPNLYEAIAGLDGKLLPFGWAKLLWRLKVSGLKTGRVPLLGLRRHHHHTPFGTAVMYGVLEHLRRGMWNAGLKRVELSWILEDNMPMRRVIEDIGGKPYKTYRIYRKDIA